MSPLLRRAFSFAPLLTICWGCTQLLGIEEASVDPALDAKGNLEGASTNTSSGGSSAAPSTETSGNSSASGAMTSTTGGGSGGSQGEAGAGSEPENSAASASGGTGTANTTTGGPEPSLCEDYCHDIMESCTGSQLQYRDQAQCMKICKMLPEGELGKINENTVACRAKYVGDARYGSGTELDAYCRRAGPGGAGYCGSNCEGYCSLMMHVCTGSDVGVYKFDSSEACVEACEALPSSDEGYAVSNPLIADGNHVECRLFHVTSAAMLDPEEHCEHAMGVTLCEATSSE
ncbi:MAG TPA: hypothetical protein VI197_10305 [Polyangiaceae bacterium]